jgi:hypothetical protein
MAMGRGTIRWLRTQSVDTASKKPDGTFANCPACGRPDLGKRFVCGKCWWEIPPRDRGMLHHMLASGQDFTSKLEAVVKGLKANVDTEKISSP